MRLRTAKLNQINQFTRDKWFGTPQLWQLLSRVHKLGAPYWVSDSQCAWRLVGTLELLLASSRIQKAARCGNLGTPLTNPLWKPKFKVRSRLRIAVTRHRKNKSAILRNYSMPIIPTTWRAINSRCWPIKSFRFLDGIISSRSGTLCIGNWRSEGGDSDISWDS